MSQLSSYAEIYDARRRTRNRVIAALKAALKGPRKAASLSRRGVARNSPLHHDRNGRDKPRTDRQELIESLFTFREIALLPAM
ncbi:hypothetical protein ALC57_12983 [Trachymyrmex cornetzi]|uniref:Uncharacterized protein n=1 Tax=Trachymyrmex cornetzi TaxID=471704 RepID=A0A195DQV6_9HYME|nr:hypothetical protein ALC57_12983 [Trachymyrmex cornetzi]